ncbi:SUN domain-containing protein 3-like, partial [Ciconia boyciana]|uniref:SUN domain-containing protein 3-like n=1 Tax=Ciconia boyciana TaxID=52775 RepID=UPI003B9E104F
MEIAEVLACSRASRMPGARTSADTERQPWKAHDLNGVNLEPFIPNETVPIAAVPRAPRVQLVTTPPLTRACARPSQSSRRERQVQDLQSLLLLSSLLLNCTGTASFTILFLLAAPQENEGSEDGDPGAACQSVLFRPAGDELGEALSETLTLQEQLRKLQEELYHLRWSVKDVAERALQEALKQAKLPGFTGWAVQEIINHVLEKLEENRVPMPDYALKSSGAAVIHSRTSPSFKNTKGKVLLFSLPVLDYVRSPELILEPENHPGNCWPFPGSQGHVFIKLSVTIIPRAVTMDHVSGTTFHGDSISRAPKDFAVYGLKEEHEEQGTFLGQFTFQAVLNPSQTFQLKNELSGFVNYIRLQVLSNWGHPDYTCLYRVRVHGDPPKDGERCQFHLAINSTNFHQAGFESVLPVTLS